METQSSVRVLGAILVLVTALVSAAVIAMGFIAPERTFEGAGLYAFFAAGVLMIVCAMIANLYDLRGILTEAFR